VSDITTATSRRIGEIFVDRGLVTAEQLERALELQLQSGDRLGEVLVAHFGVPRLELASVLAEQWSDADRPAAFVSPDVPAAPAAPSLADVEREVEEIDRRPLGEIFVQSGFVTAEELERALVAQKETGQRLGEALVAQGSITRLELASALAEQWAGLPKLRPPSSPQPERQDGRSDGFPPAPSAPLDPHSPPPAEPALGARLDELATRLDDLAGQAAAAGELTELRARLDELAARPIADSDAADRATERLDELAHRVQSLADLTAERAGVAERLDELERRVQAVGALDGDLIALRHGLDELQSRPAADPEAPRRLQELEHRVASLPASPAADGLPREAETRLDALEHRLAATAAADDVREAFGAVREEIREIAAHLDEPGDAPAVDALMRRIEGIEARLSDASEQHKVRTAIAELQAEVGALGGHDEKGRLDELAERLEGLESVVPAASVLDQLRDDVAALVARGASEDGLARRVDALAGDVERLQSEPRPAPGPDPELLARLDHVERQLTVTVAAEEVREVFAAVRTEMSEVDARLDGATVAPDLLADVEELRARLDARELHAVERSDLDALRAALAELRRELVALASRDDRGRFDAIHARLDELARGRVEHDPSAALVELAERQAAIEARAALLEERPDTAAELAAMRAELLAIAARPEPDRSIAPRVDDLAARLDRLAAESARSDDVDALRHAVAELELRPTADPTLPDRLGELAHRTEAWQSAATGLDALAARVGELERRPQGKAGLGDAVNELRATVSALDERLEATAASAASTADAASLRQRLDALAARVGELSQRAAGDPSLAGRLEAAEERLAGELVALRRHADEKAATLTVAATELEAALLGRIGAAVAGFDARSDELGRTLSTELDHLAGRLEEVEALTLRAAALEEGSRAAQVRLDELGDAVEAQRTAWTETVETVERHTATLRTRTERHAEELASLAQAGEQHDRAVAQLGEDVGARLELLAASGDAEARAGLDALRDRLAALASTLDELSATAASSLEQSREVTARVDELAARDTKRADAERAELDVLATRVEELDAAGIVARDEARAELEQLTGSLGWRLEKVEDALAGDDTAELRDAVARVEQRQDVQEELQDERVRVTEKALRKGLTALAERLAQSEEDYVRAGNALRRSIERLGSAIVETDVATAERTSDALALHHANATAYVAFAPTPDGYRLVAVDGRAPAVGEQVQLPQCEAALRVTRLGTSPIPLDTRPCAYLERV
jgi:tetrahydromethanopterin S-methyltransferase subunit G